MRRTLCGVVVLLALLFLASGVLAQGGSGYELTWWTTDHGGDTWSAGGSFTLGGSIGQPDAGQATGSSYTLYSGFWQPAVNPDDTLVIAKTAEDLNSAPLYEGDVIEYVITVTNTATMAHSGILIQDAIPGGTTYIPGSANPAQGSGPDPLVWMVATLNPGERRTFAFRVTVDAGLAGQSIAGNVAAVTSDQQSEPIATPPTWPPGGGDVQPTPDLQLAKTAQDLNGAPLYEGDVIEYVITVTNAAATPLNGVVISDAIPAHMTYVSGSADPTPTSGPDPLVWAVGNLAPGQSVTVTFQVTVDEGAAGQTIENQAEANSDQTEPVVTPPVEPPGGGEVQPYLTLVKVAGDVDGPPLLVGDEIEYHVLVFNPATITVTDVWLEDFVPENTSYVAASVGASAGSITGPDPFRVEEETHVGRGMLFFHFRVTVEPLDHIVTITNTATAAVGPHNPVTAQAVVGPVGGDNVGLVIGKVAADLNGAPLNEGDVIEYTIGLANTDDVTHTHVVVSDTIPSGTTYVSGSANPPQSGGPDPLVWTVDTLPAKKIVFFTFRVAVNAGMAGQTISGNVAVTDSDQQGEPAETPPIYPGPVGPREPPGYVWPSGLVVAKVAEDLNGAPLHEGDVVRYVITVTNTSTETHTHVAVQDAIPGGTTYVSGSANPPQSGGPNPLVWGLATLNPGERRTLAFRVTVDEGTAGQTIDSNVGTVASNETDNYLITPPTCPGGNCAVEEPSGPSFYYLPYVVKGAAKQYCYLPLVVKSPTSPPAGDEYEPDGACAQANPLDFGSPQVHTFDPEQDEDWVKFQAEAETTYIVQTSDLTGGADTKIQLFAPDCVVMLAEDDDGGIDLASRLEWTAPANDTYHVRVFSYDPSVAGPGVGYTISIQESAR